MKQIRVYHEKDILNLTKDNKSIIIIMKQQKYDKLTFPDWIEDIEICNYKYDLDNLPSSVVKLSLIDCDNNLDNLPLYLKSLEICLRKKSLSQPLYYLNEGLEYLKISTKQPFKHALNNLPFTLRGLELACNDINYDYDISNLPDGLEELYLCCNFHFDNLPKNLKTIRIINKIPNLKEVEEKIRIMIPKVNLTIYNYYD